jgi:hypothetical protein
MIDRAIRKNRTPPSRWSCPVRHLPSTRVPNIVMAKIRNPFLRSERGTASKTRRASRHDVRNSTCARTIVATSNIRLERMLLHSCATSTFGPGMERKTPWNEVGTLAAENNSHAARADPHSNICTILTSANKGIGTIQKRKQRGKSRDRAAVVRKHRTNAAIHKTTIASMPIESRTSGTCQALHNVAETAIRIPTVSKDNPGHTFREDERCPVFRCEKINVMLTGRIRSMWVNSASRSAWAKVLNKGRHKIAEESSHRNANPR